MNFIDVFAGASGMSEGFIKAGFIPISHIEMNTEACLTIKTRAAFHYLESTKKDKIYNDYLNGIIDRDTLCELRVNTCIIFIFSITKKLNYQFFH